VIILSRALASGLVGVFAHKRFSRSEQVHHSRKQHKESWNFYFPFCSAGLVSVLVSAGLRCW
jgi:hypothetical protein